MTGSLSGYWPNRPPINVPNRGHRPEKREYGGGHAVPVRPLRARHLGRQAGPGRRAGGLDPLQGVQRDRRVCVPGIGPRRRVGKNLTARAD